MNFGDSGRNRHSLYLRYCPETGLDTDLYRNSGECNQT